jgi:hypothetical protein
MAGYDLNGLIGALKSTVGKGQRTLRRQQQEVLQRIIDVGENGEPECLTWVCWLPSGNGGERSYEMMRIRLASLPSTQMMEISELSVELNCRIKETQPEEDPNLSNITVVPIRKSKKQKDKANRIRITMRGPEGGEGEVTVDGVALKETDDDRFLLSKEELSQLLRKDSSKIKRLFPWKSPLFWLLIVLLMATTAALIIHLGVLPFH